MLLIALILRNTECSVPLVVFSRYQIIIELCSHIPACYSLMSRDMRNIKTDTIQALDFRNP